jgi:hypothetical protein
MVPLAAVDRSAAILRAGDRLYRWQHGAEQAPMSADMSAPGRRPVQGLGDEWRNKAIAPYVCKCRLQVK